MNLPQTIKDYKKKTGESIPDIAVNTGIPEANLYKWQKGTKPTNLEHYNILIAYMNGKLENVPRGTLEKPEEPTVLGLLQKHNDTLEKIILSNLNGLKDILKTNQILLMTVTIQQTAHDEVIMGSLDRLEKHKEGTLSSKADKKELEVRENMYRMGIVHSDGI